MTNAEIDRLLAVRDALVAEDYAEAYHHLYQLADRGRISLTPWDEWEAMGNREKFIIEYESGGKWYFWKYASSRKRAEELIAGRTNPVSLCRIRENK